MNRTSCSISIGLQDFLLLSSFFVFSFLSFMNSITLFLLSYWLVYFSGNWDIVQCGCACSFFLRRTHSYSESKHKSFEMVVAYVPRDSNTQAQMRSRCENRFFRLFYLFTQESRIALLTGHYSFAELFPSLLLYRCVFAFFVFCFFFLNTIISLTINLMKIHSSFFIVHKTIFCPMQRDIILDSKYIACRVLYFILFFFIAISLLLWLYS